MSEVRPNRNPALKSVLSQRLLDHLDTQLLNLGASPDELIDRTEAQPRGHELQARVNAQYAPRREPQAPGIRLSNGLACNVCLPLYMQVRNYARTHNMPVSQLLRTALEWFLDEPFTRPVHITGRTVYLPRKAMLTFTISPKANPGLRERLDTYAAENRRVVAAVVRRAAYEYTRDKSEIEDLGVMHDAWADADVTRT